MTYARVVLPVGVQEVDEQREGLLTIHLSQETVFLPAGRGLDRQHDAVSSMVQVQE